MRGYETLLLAGSDGEVRLRIPMRGYEPFQAAISRYFLPVTNPHAGL